jgi:hypothetical protein
MTAALFLFAFGVATALAALDLPIGTVHMPGSGFFPLALGATLAALAAAEGIRVYLATPKPAAPAPSPGPAAAAPGADDGTRRVLLFMGAVVLATLLLPVLGYAVTSLLLMAALLRILGVAGWGRAGAISVGTALACYFVFVRLLGIPLPSGWAGL